MHDQERIENRKRARLAAKAARDKGATFRGILKVIHSVCAAKGWRSHTSSIDEKNWRYATIDVSRSVGPYRATQVTGTLDLTHDDGTLALQLHITSFHGYGLKNLYEDIVNELELARLISAERDAPDTQAKPIDTVKSIIGRFYRIAQQMKHRHDGRPTLLIEDEYDVQDLLNALLKSAFDDVRPEEATPSFAGSSSRIDFLLKEEGVLIEVKMTSDKVKDKQIGEQLLIDIKRYQAHPDCSTLVCMVYDPGGHLKNRAGLQNDLSGKHEKLDVHVIVIP